MAQLSHPYMTTGKTIALTKWTFVGKVMSLLFNTLFRFVIAFLPRSKCPTIPCRPTEKGADGAPDGSLRGVRPRDVQGCLMDSTVTLRPRACFWGLCRPHCSTWSTAVEGDEGRQGLPLLCFSLETFEEEDGNLDLGGPQGACGCQHQRPQRPPWRRD